MATMAISQRSHGRMHLDYTNHCCFDSMPTLNNFTQNNLRISNLNNVQLHT
jgi:hypothetical protein